MTPKLTDELEQAVARDPHGTLRVDGANGTYWVMTEDAMQIRTQVLQGLEQADRGEVEPWDAEEIKREGRRLLRERSQDI